MPFDFSKECKDNGVSEEFVKSIDKKLFPLLEKALIINPNFNQFFSQGNKEARRTTFENFRVFEGLLDRIKKQMELYPQEIAILFMIDYLTAIESLLTYVVDTITFALVSTGINLENPKNKDSTNKKYVIMPDEIKLIPLGTKLDFLSSNGFLIISKRCSVRIRNSSGHLNYTVDAEGNIRLPQGDEIKVFKGMNEYHHKLRDATRGGFIAIRHFYYEKYGKFKP